jgi:hypothetical protein
VRILKAKVQLGEGRNLAALVDFGELSQAATRGTSIHLRRRQPFDFER